MKRLVQIVDANDEVIGSKPRAEIDYSVDIYRTATLWVEDSKDEVLIAQRKLTKDKDPGKWGPAVAGTVDEGETYESNIEKESEEEIGLTGISIQPVEKFFENTPRKQFIKVFKAVVNRSVSDFTIQEEEVERLAWVPRSELREDVLANPDKYVPAMGRLVALIEQRF